MARVYNFSAGPSMLPLPVLEKAAAELTCYQSSGMSVMEMSHRSKVYEEIIFSAEKLLREILNVPENYKILFLQGGASTQFSNIPMNLLLPGEKAAYAVTGQFAKKAYTEAKKFGQISVAASSEDRNFSYIPAQESIQLDGDEKYFHYCANNTIFGTEWKYVPDTKGIPLVSDMSSNILSKPVDVSKYGIIYAGAQKNMGPAGLAVVIVRQDLLKKCPPNVPTMSDYSVMAENDSMYNTPPTYTIYILKLVLEWLKDLGGLEAMQKINVDKAAVLYNYLDSSKMFIATADKDCRSMMNVTFKTNSEELDAKFVKEAAANGFANIKGHRAVGGMRASIYNAMPKEGTLKLVKFMEQFEKENKNV